VNGKKRDPSGEGQGLGKGDGRCFASGINEGKGDILPAKVQKGEFYVKD